MQCLLRICLSETMPAQDRQDGVGDFCVANYLLKFGVVHWVVL
ncbi:MAG: hypothetical protein ABR514_03680 [Chthoniobacterales bacterium]